MHVIIIGGRFRSVLGGSAPLPMTRPTTLGRLSCFMEPLQARLPRHASLPCWCYLFAFSALSFDCPWLQPLFLYYMINFCLLAFSFRSQIPMQTPWQQQDLSFPAGSPLRGHSFQDSNHEWLVTPRPSMRPITEECFPLV